MKHRRERTAPYWVHKNDSHSDVHHDHLRFGKPVLRWQPLRSEDGSPVMVPVTETRTIADVLASFEGTGAWREAKLLRSRGAALTDMMTRETGEMRQARVLTHSGTYADFCTEGMKLTRDGRLVAHPELIAPCTAWPGEKYYSRYPHDRTRNGGERRSARMNAHRTARLARRSDEFDDIEDMYELSE